MLGDSTLHPNFRVVFRCTAGYSWLQLATAGYSWLMYSYARPNIASTKDASDRQQLWGREAPRDPGYDGVSGRPCSLAEMAMPDAVVRRHATNKVVVLRIAIQIGH